MSFSYVKEWSFRVQLAVRISGQTVLINSAKVTTANVNASNGVVHIIDRVLLPSGPTPTPGPPIPIPGKTIVDLAVATPDLSTLVTAVKAGGLADTLSGQGPFTVFAPTNEAFAALPAGVLPNLLKPANKAALDFVLKYHVVSGALRASALKDGQRLVTLEGSDLYVKLKGKDVFINSVKVTTADVIASNGVVHIVNGVLLPGQNATAL